MVVRLGRTTETSVFTEPKKVVRSFTISYNVYVCEAKTLKASWATQRQAGGHIELKIGM